MSGRGSALSDADQVAEGVQGLQVEGPAPVVDGAEVGALPVGHVRVLLDVAHVEGLEEDKKDYLPCFSLVVNMGMIIDVPAPVVNSGSFEGCRLQH